MNGPQHYLASERLLSEATHSATNPVAPRSVIATVMLLARAIGHGVLALVASQASPIVRDAPDWVDATRAAAPPVNLRETDADAARRFAGTLTRVDQLARRWESVHDPVYGPAAAELRSVLDDCPRPAAG